MRPRDHVILGGVAAGALYPMMGPNAVLLWLASFAVDIDHYLDFVYHNGFTDFSFTRMLEYHNALSALDARPEFLNVSIFHTVEFLAPLYAVAAYTGSGAIAAVFWGILIHMTLDALYLMRRRALLKRSHSIIEYLIRRRRLVRRGFSPIGIYNQAIKVVRTNALNLR